MCERGQLHPVSDRIYVHESVFDATFGGAALNPLGLILGRGLDETYLAMQAEYENAPSFVSVRISDLGVVDGPCDNEGREKKIGKYDRRHLRQFATCYSSIQSASSPL